MTSTHFIKITIPEWFLTLALLVEFFVVPLSAQSPGHHYDTFGHHSSATTDGNKKSIHKVLILGDSMTGWLGERLNAYGQKNGFEVATIVWDGSTIRKWGSSAKLKQMIDAQKPDLVMVSLGLNELYEKNPEKTLGKSIDNILKAVGSRDLLWIGPPSWPGRSDGKILDEWLEDRVGEGRYFSSLSQTLQRQSAKNPHPSRTGIITWIESITQWIPDNTAYHLPLEIKPGPSEMSRGKTFIYRRMKETL